MTSPSRRLPTALRALSHRQYRQWTAAGTLSVTGTWMQVATQSWVLLQLSGSGAVLGAGLAVNALPGLLLGPWAGVAADRFSRRRILIATQSTFAVLAGALALAATTGHLTVGIVLLFSTASGVVAAIDAPAAAALGTTLVPEDDLANAAALGSGTNSLGRIVGMSLAGLVIAAVGPNLAFALNAVSYVPVITVLMLLREPTGATEAVPMVSPFAGIREGLAFVTRTRHLGSMILLAFVLGALGRNYQVTMALMVNRVFHLGAAGYATASTSFAVGALAGAVVAAHLRRVSGVTVLVAGVVAAIGQLSAGLAPNIVVFVAVIAGTAAAAVVLDTAVSTRATLSSPDALRGRVLALLAAASGGAGVLGGPTLGLLGEHLGARGALVVGSTVCLAACAIQARRVVSEEPGSIGTLISGAWTALTRASRHAPEPIRRAMAEQSTR